MIKFDIITIVMARTYPRGIYVTDEKLILATKQGGALAPSPPLSSYKSHHHHCSKVIKTVREDINRKKTFSFRHCLNHLLPLADFPAVLF